MTSLFVAKTPPHRVVQMSITRCHSTLHHLNVNCQSHDVISCPLCMYNRRPFSPSRGHWSCECHRAMRHVTSSVTLCHHPLRHHTSRCVTTRRIAQVYVKCSFRSTAYIHGYCLIVFRNIGNGIQLCTYREPMPPSPLTGCVAAC